MTADADATRHASEARFTAFYETAVRDVYRYFTRATAGDKARAEDLTQETFMAAVKASNGGHPDAYTMPWIMGVARHKLVDHYRREARELRKLVLVSTTNSDSNSGVSVDLHDVTEEQSVQMLRDLSPTHRLILTLRYLDDLSVADVAQLVGRSVSATQSLLIRARA